MGDKTVVLTNLGQAWAVGRLAGTVSTTGKYVGWGEGGGTAQQSDSDLATPAAESRASGTVTAQGSGATAKYQVQATLTSSSDQHIGEAATFDASTAGTMVLYMTWDGYDLNTDDQITFTFSLDPG